MEFMLTLAIVGALATLTVAGIVVLPWSDAELTESVDACRAIGEGAGQALASVATAGERVGATIEAGTRGHLIRI